MPLPNSALSVEVLKLTQELLTLGVLQFKQLLHIPPRLEQIAQVVFSQQSLSSVGVDLLEQGFLLFMARNGLSCFSVYLLNR